jgi:hypothetical protein
MLMLLLLFVVELSNSHSQNRSFRCHVEVTYDRDGLSFWPPAPLEPHFTRTFFKYTLCSLKSGRARKRKKKFRI